MKRVTFEVECCRPPDFTRWVRQDVECYNALAAFRYVEDSKKAGSKLEFRVVQCERTVVPEPDAG